jgi:putative NADH-flavin reductase
MRIVIFGANGRVGNLVVKEALKRGHKVSAFVHSRSSFDYNPSLKIVKGDIYNPKDVENAVKGSDAVISALGSWGTPKKDILTTGMKNIIPAMQNNKTKRIVSLTGSDALAPGDTKTLIYILSHFTLSRLAPKILKDGETHIKLLSDSDLNWTVVRSPVMNSRPKPWSTINRKSVALAMLDLAESNKNVKSAPHIIRK